MGNKIRFLSLVALAAAIIFSPSISVGLISGHKALEIRLEDFLLLIFGLLWILEIILFKKSRIDKPVLIFPIVLYLSLGFFSLVVNIVFRNLDFDRAVFFFLKEVEFFLIYFYFFCRLKTKQEAFSLIRVLLFFLLLNSFWIIYQLLSGQRITYYYGPTAIAEPDGPLPSGGIFFISFIFIFSLWLFYYSGKRLHLAGRSIFFAVFVFSGISLLASGSRTIFASMLIALVTSFFLYFKTGGFKKVFSVVFIIVLFFVLSFSFISPLMPKLPRLLETSSIEFELSGSRRDNRMGVWKIQLEKAVEHSGVFVLGLGKSVLLAEGETHNHYLRTLIETGIFGLAVFLFLLFSIIKKSLNNFLNSKDNIEAGLSAGVLAATFGLAVAALFSDIFWVVKVSENYWLFVAIAFRYHNLNINNICAESSER